MSLTRLLHIIAIVSEPNNVSLHSCRLLPPLPPRPSRERNDTRGGLKWRRRLAPRPLLSPLPLPRCLEAPTLSSWHMGSASAGPSYETRREEPAPSNAPPMTVAELFLPPFKYSEALLTSSNLSAYYWYHASQQPTSSGNLPSLLSIKVFSRVPISYLMSGNVPRKPTASSQSPIHISSLPTVASADEMRISLWLLSNSGPKVCGLQTRLCHLQCIDIVLTGIEGRGLFSRPLLPPSFSCHVPRCLRASTWGCN